MSEISILPDAVDRDRVIIIKTCGFLRLTSELVTADAVASKKGRELVLVVPEETQFSEPLAEFIAKESIIECKGATFRIAALLEGVDKEKREC
jgi:hypothetical protein